jgi:hypothetical protein
VCFVSGDKSKFTGTVLNQVWTHFHRYMIVRRIAIPTHKVGFGQLWAMLPNHVPKNPIQGLEQIGGF